MATATTAIPTQPGRLIVDFEDVSMLRDIKKAISMLKGVTKVQAQRPKPRLYDPVTGEYLNDKTMKAIEDVRSGKDEGTTYESFEDFKKAMLARRGRTGDIYEGDTEEDEDDEEVW